MVNLPAFVWGNNGEQLTPDQLAKKRALLDAIQARGTDTSPVQSWTQGAARVLDSIGNVVEDNRLTKAEKGNQDYNQQIVNSLLGGSSPSAAGQTIPAPGASGEIAAVSGTPVDISGDKETFVASLLPAAIEESKRTGVDPRIIVAQAAQETGWGKSAPNNNYFGIKSHGQPGGSTLATKEYVNGQPQTQMASFRGYASPEDSVRGYGDFILQNPRYTGLRQAQGLDAQLQALGASGYATDPNYASSVGAIAKGIRLPEQTGAISNASNAIQAQAPASGYVDPQVSAQPASQFRGSDYNAPMLTYDERGARVERPSQSAPPATQPAGGGMTADQFDQRFSGNAAPMATDAPQVYSDAMPPLDAPRSVGAAPPVAQVSAPVAPAAPATVPTPGIDRNALIRALTDPRANSQTQAVAQALLSQQQRQEDRAYQLQLQQQDPLRQSQIQLAQAKVDKLSKPGADEKFFGNPIAIQTPDGVKYGQIGDRGGFKPIDIGEGNKFAPPTKTVNTETEQLIYDNFGNLLSRVPIQNRVAEREKEVGKAEGKSQADAVASLPQSIATADMSIKNIDAILNDPNLDYAVGAYGIAPAIPGTAQAGLVSRIEQLQGTAFLQAFKDLKGGGAITEVEGQKATAAIARLRRTQNKADFTEALNELKSIIESGRQRAIDKARSASPQNGQASQDAQTQAPQTKRLKYNPVTGELE